MPIKYKVGFRTEIIFCHIYLNSSDRFPPEVRQWVKDKTGKTSVPQIFFHDQHIGGNVELQQLLDSAEAKREALAKLEAGPGDGELPMIPHPSEVLEEKADDIEFECEKDELAQVMSRLLESGILKSHRKGLLSSAVPNVIKGSDLLSFLTDTEKESGVGDELIQTGLLVGLSGKKTLAGEALYTPSHLLDSRGLNSGQLAECKVRDADTMARDLRKVVLKLFADFLSEDGRRVDYVGMAESSTWEKFTLMATQLQRVNIEDISDQHKLAFFINVYNVLVIHGTVVKGVPSSMYQRYKFFAHTCYNIGGHLLSLNDIENGILRSNRSSMATLYRKPFGSNDPRLAIILPTVDPRIHFALNCGAKSCPPIKTFTGDEVEEQLEVATQAYLESEDALLVDTGAKQVKLSMLFKWYAEDFGNNRDEILTWIQEHLGDPVKKQALQGVGEAPSVSYIPYDWGNNAKE